MKEDVDYYVEKVRRAMNSSASRELSREEYVDALEEIAADVDGMLEAAKEELAAEQS